MKEKIYLSAFHLCEKVSEKDIKIRSFNLLNGIVFLLSLSLYFFIVGKIQNSYDITMNIGVNSLTIISFILILVIIHYSLKAIFKEFIDASEIEIKQMKNTVSKSTLTWTIPALSIFSIICFGLSVAFGGNSLVN